MMWWMFALLSAFFAALTAILAKIGVKGIDSNLATAIRTVVILLVAWGIVFATGGEKNLAAIPHRSLMFLIFSGITTGLSWIFYFRALQMGNASQVAPVDKTSIVMVLILAALCLHEPMTPKVVLGAVLIVAGTLVLVL